MSPVMLFRPRGGDRVSAGTVSVVFFSQLWIPRNRKATRVSKNTRFINTSFCCFLVTFCLAGIYKITSSKSIPFCAQKETVKKVPVITN